MNEQLDWAKQKNEKTEFSYRPLSEELLFLNAVADGNINLVQQNCIDKRFSDPVGLGTLSTSPVMNMKYHFVITAALLSRKCIESGMSINEAFGLSDYYIQRLDKVLTIPDIAQLHVHMVMDYTRRMRLIKHPNASKQVIDAIDFIYSHITERITVDMLSDSVHISQAYFSRLFKKEIGISVSSYIRDRKIEYAKKLLKFSEMEMADIAAYLSFSSQSHFIQQFRQQTGLTPKAFRDQNHGVRWNEAERGGTAEYPASSF